MSTFKAIRIDKGETSSHASYVDFSEADLMDGDVTVRVSHSSINYKDGLAITGKSPVVRRFPMIPGIDSAGIVEASTHKDFKPGDAVLLTGWGVGETHLGGLAQKLRVKGDWLVPMPKGLDAHSAMAIGTAGFTAMLSLLALERHGMTPAHGSALVTGAAGGVGSVATALLHKAGYHVIASTGRPEESEYLFGLGADEILDRATLSEPGRPLGKERWACAIDAVGSHTLANALAQTRYGGAVAACGLAQGMDLPTSVAPFILRGISLLGIDSVMCPQPLRRAAWQRLATDLDHDKIASLTIDIPFSQAIEAGAAILSGKIRGRVVVKIDE
ncbi:MAG: oxidoreductase [Hyphomicrobiales bacterium]|nr:oxidoreductase [Hyphomicrobiales bacterium]MDE2115816.1 oxidoreductase [Hyphomicrobiales bacterium]